MKGALYKEIFKSLIGKKINLAGHSFVWKTGENEDIENVLDDHAEYNVNRDVAVAAAEFLEDLDI